jgi:hypothetical protein
LNLKSLNLSSQPTRGGARNLTLGGPR